MISQADALFDVDCSCVCSGKKAGLAGGLFGGKKLKSGRSTNLGSRKARIGAVGKQRRLILFEGVGARISPKDHEYQVELY